MSTFPYIVTHIRCVNRAARYFIIIQPFQMTKQTVEAFPTVFNRL